MKKLQDVKFDHETAISEEGINKAELPADVRQKIQVFSIQRGKALKKCERGEEVTENDIARLEAMSVKIASDIYDYLEAEVEELEKEKAKKSVTTPAAATAPAAVAPTPAAEPAPATVASVITPAAEPAPAAATPPAAKEPDDFVLFDGLI